MTEGQSFSDQTVTSCVMQNRILQQYLLIGHVTLLVSESLLHRLIFSNWICIDLGDIGLEAESLTLSLGAPEVC